ncbi:uncharacterized protein LOC107360564 [Tetranychus urticae]|uniref:uncharacterized protein LOC107360564 n=1 Tax=Tetranychus urticae TaxID=32264 RepID=UPI00077BB6F8|nr:uncharacterized protein LOC107360564 [Tetranychus urticae]
MVDKVQIFFVLLVLVGPSFCGYFSPPLNFPGSFQIPSPKSFLSKFGPPVRTYTTYHSHLTPGMHSSPGIHSYLGSQQQPPTSPYHSLHSLHGYQNGYQNGYPNGYPNRPYL